MTAAAIARSGANPHIYEKHYAHCTPAEIRAVAADKMREYSSPPLPELAGAYALLRSAWQWAADRHREADGEQP